MAATESENVAHNRPRIERTGVTIRPQEDTLKLSTTGDFQMQPHTTLIHPRSRTSDLWNILFAGLLTKWIYPTPSLLPFKEQSARKARVANKLYNAFKKIKLKNWLARKEISPAPIFNAGPNRTSEKYNNCFVLLLVWERDDIGGAIKEAESLKKELEERWGFWGDIYRIPFEEEDTVQQAVVESAVEAFIDHRDEKSNLLLVHYGGHGGLNGSKEYVFQQYNNGRLHEVKIKPIRERLRECEADVGLILDACYSEAAVYRSVESHTVEVLAACSEENKTVGVSPESFTNGILRVLRVRGETVNMHQLSQELERLTYPKLSNKPVHHMIGLSLWGTIRLRREVGGLSRYPNVNPLFPF